MAIIDEPSLQKMIAGDELLLADLVTMFVQLLPDMKARLRLALEENHTGNIESIAHQLRSRVSYFGANSLVQKIKHLERTANGNQRWDNESLFGDVMHDVDQLLNELRQKTRLSLAIDED